MTIAPRLAAPNEDARTNVRIDTLLQQVPTASNFAFACRSMQGCQADSIPLLRIWSWHAIWPLRRSTKNKLSALPPRYRDRSSSRVHHTARMFYRLRCGSCDCRELFEVLAHPRIKRLAVEKDLASKSGGGSPCFALLRQRQE
jgi:hypothetical protein